MTREDSIKILNPATSFDALLGMDREEGIKVVEEACLLAVADMEKQIPKFVESKGYKGIRDTRYKCPVCKKFVRVNTKHCDECGQALKFPKLKRIDNRFGFDWTEEGE